MGRLLIIVMGILTRKQSGGAAQSMPWGPPFTSSLGFCISCIWSSFLSREYGFHQNLAVFTFQCYLQQLRCLWIMFHYSLLSCVPRTLQHVDNNTPVQMTHALHTSVCSHGSGWPSNNRCSALVLLSLCHKTQCGPHFLLSFSPSYRRSTLLFLQAVHWLELWLKKERWGQWHLSFSTPFTSFTRQEWYSLVGGGLEKDSLRVLCWAWETPSCNFVQMPALLGNS